MKYGGDLDQEVKALRDRLSRLSEASLRINESLDLETVLQEVVDNARSLTDATYGVIVLLDGSGQIEDLVSSGLTREETEQLQKWPEGLVLLEYLTNIREPLRLQDFHSHTQSLGLPEFRPPMPVSSSMSFMDTPIRHRDQAVGNFFVAEKQGGREFTEQDEETLVMFASQAAMVIANARRYREEQRAKNDLETLINTSPVGVVVCDAKTGIPVSFNREAVRIFEGLRTPDHPLEQLLEVLTICRADGAEISLDEFPLAEVLKASKPIRAEEVVMKVPDGRSVTTLINATPIHSEKGKVESVVVTLQDMTPLKEMERLRAEFLAMVSHELRTPLTSIKGSAATVLNTFPAYGLAEMREFFRIINHQADQMSIMITDLLDVARIETGTLSVSPEPAEVTLLVDQAKTTFQSGGGKNNIHIDLGVDLPRVMADRQRIIQVLCNLLSNAARHSHDASAIRVSVVWEGAHVAFAVADKGIGMSSELLPHLFQKFSRVESDDKEARVGASGLGLAICKGIVEAHGGRIWAESDGPNMGARITFTIPVAEGYGDVTGAGATHHSAHPRRPERQRQPILVVDDDPQTLRYVRDTLSNAGYKPIVTADPVHALDLMVEEKPALALLDLVLPGYDGFELMQDILDIASVPVIFLSAYGQEEIVAKAFDNGADDYIVKPFSPTELSARIRAALRRRESNEPAEPSEPYRHGDLTIDYVTRSVTVAGSPIRLTAIEYRLLAELSANDGRVLSHDQLLQRVWLARGSDADSRSMRTAVKNLRRKLGDDANNPTYIFTEPRVGYGVPKAEKPVAEGSESPNVS